MRSETRNILLYIKELKNEISRDEIEMSSIKYLINEIIERIQYQIEKEQQDYNYLLKELKDNQELLNNIK